MTSPFVEPDLAAVTAALVGAGAAFVVIGGFAVIANDFVRATEDVDFLIPDDETNDRALDAALTALDAHWLSPERPFAAGDLAGREHSRLTTRAGLVDLLREGAPPLDFATVHENAHVADLGAGRFRVAGLSSIVAFKRLAGRPRDKADLDELREIHGELPIDPLPGLDS
ncbi:MAG: hypothetical protein ACJ76L_07265 [Conexibacter sp.]